MKVIKGPKKLGGKGCFVYIGRGSVFGNPYVIGVHGNRAEVIEKYRQRIKTNKQLQQAIKQLPNDAVLVCYCKPKPCHGDIIREYYMTTKSSLVPFIPPSTATINKRSSRSPYKAISFFAGCGGSSLGYKLAGFNVLYANEFIPAAYETYKANAPKTIVDSSDIRKVKVKDLLTTLKLKRGQLDLLDGSPPCFLADTLITTDKGLVPIQDVRVGDMVRTHTGKYQRVYAVMQREYVGDMYTIKSENGIPLQATDEHPFYAKKSDEEPTWVASQAITNEHYLAHPAGCKQVGMNLSSSWYPYSSHAFWSFVGAWLADGENRVTKHRKLAINSTDTKEVTWHKAMRYVGWPGVSFGAEIDGILTRYTKGDEKHIPAEVFALPIEYQRTLLISLFKGDPDKAYEDLSVVGTKQYILSLAQIARSVFPSANIYTDRLNDLYVCIIKHNLNDIIGEEDLLIPEVDLEQGVESESGVGDSATDAQEDETDASVEVIETTNLVPLDVYEYVEPEDDSTKDVDDLTENDESDDEALEGNRICTEVWSKVVTTFSETQNTYVYNISVEEDESYIADDYVVHNCAAFSQAGTREKGWGEERTYSDTKQRVDDLFDHYIRMVKGFMPKTFVAENVPGLASGSAAPILLDIISKLESLGYMVDARIINAGDLGLAQARRRLIIVGVRNDIVKKLSLGSVPYPQKIKGSVTVKRVLPNINLIRVSDRGTMVMDSATRMSPTITASDASTSPTAIFSCGGFVEDDEGNFRKYTIDELKVLFGFPSDFVLTGTFEQQWERLGRSHVPVSTYYVGKTLLQEILMRL